jgi:hypothetical protein
MPEQRREADSKQNGHRNDPRPRLSFTQPVGKRSDPAFEVGFIDLKEYDENNGKYTQRHHPKSYIKKLYRQEREILATLTNKASAATSYSTSSTAACPP